MKILEVMKKFQKDCNRLRCLIRDSKHEEALLLYDELRNYVRINDVFGQQYKGNYSSDFRKLIRTIQTHLNEVNSCVLALLDYSLSNEWNAEIDVINVQWNKVFSSMHPEFNMVETLKNFSVLRNNVVKLIKKVRKTDEIGFEDKILSLTYLLERLSNPLNNLNNDQLKELYTKITIAFNAACFNSLKNPDDFSNISTLLHTWLGLLLNKTEYSENDVEQLAGGIDFTGILERNKASFNNKNSKRINISAILLNIPGKIIGLNVSHKEKNEKLFDYFSVIYEFGLLIDENLLEINLIISKSNSIDNNQIRNIALSLDKKYSMDGLLKLMNALDNYQKEPKKSKTSHSLFFKKFAHKVNKFFIKIKNKISKFIRIIHIHRNRVKRIKKTENINHSDSECTIHQLNSERKVVSGVKGHQYGKLFSSVRFFPSKKRLRFKLHKKVMSFKSRK